MAVQGHRRSLILVPIESAYGTYYWSSIVTLVLSCPVSEILLVFCWKERPHPIPPEFWGVPLGPDVVAPKCEDPKLIIRAISFELTQHIRPRYINVTDRQTAYDSNTALALCASHSKSSFTGLVSSEFKKKLSLKVPSHLQQFATLHCSM